MTKARRAATLVHLAWMAHGGSLCVASPDADVGQILHCTSDHVMEVPLEDGPNGYAARLRLACQLFASAALSEVGALGFNPEDLP
jgi:hypothetical protein